VDLENAASKVVNWLSLEVLKAARGDEETFLEVEPEGRFWLGRLAPQEAVVRLGLGERGERLDPCAISIRIRPKASAPWSFTAIASCCVWLRDVDKQWHKRGPIEIPIQIENIDAAAPVRVFGSAELTNALAGLCSQPGLSAELRVELEFDLRKRPELIISLVNTSPEKDKDIKDTNLYECSLTIKGLETAPFILEALPDSFRYDRSVEAYGTNCGVERLSDGSIRTTDAIFVDRGRPEYWNADSPTPDLSFLALVRNPISSLRALHGALSSWGSEMWSPAALAERKVQHAWTEEMEKEAARAAVEFCEESARIAMGIDLLEKTPDLLQAFKLMNQAISHSSRGRYSGWRPFQVGFMLANLASIVESDNDSDIADIVWFATGGGKTETYLGLLVTAAFFDRLRGKKDGITAWSRFPLRMLSLQQTQRFADALAGAELVRLNNSIGGSPFSLGFLVGESSTPNSIPIEPKEGKGPDIEDEEMPRRYRVLLKCPFCQEESIEMAFNRLDWKLEHRCMNEACPWLEPALPFYIVDDEVFRFLPTVIVGTLDKAALISFQAAMRGLVGPPIGCCSIPGHGYTYSPRKKRPNGCLVPGCPGEAEPLEMESSLYAPTFRLQDELHLLRDSLGAVDAHYETLYDHLQMALSGRKPKILASSATLTGYENQVEVLYQRRARVFPLQGPSAEEGFWSSETNRLMRRFVALAPRGQTLEFAVDRILTDLQNAIRRFSADPVKVASEIGVDPGLSGELISLYGTNVLYGNTLRDLDASVRSLETQIMVPGALNTTSLTGKTFFEDVRQVLDRLGTPEGDFYDRIHVVAASSMMSHGVDVDRLNVMVVMGLPLATAEFIQATARVGRKWPGLVFVFHKIARERDASVYKSFAKFVEQGDRFVEAIPITRRSRRVLERTIPGLLLARILAIHEPQSGQALTLVSQLREYFGRTKVSLDTELSALREAVGLEGPLDELLLEDLTESLENFLRNLNNPAGDFRFPADLCRPGRPMRSLRDVEEQVPILGVIEK
jgi:hypothetical protein